MGVVVALARTATEAAEARRHERLELVDRQLPGTLSHAATGEPIFAVAVDVSKVGLGIAAGEALAVGSVVVLTTETSERMALRVVWQKKKRRDGRVVFRHGLALVDAEADLVGAFFAAGCMEYELEENPDF